MLHARVYILAERLCMESLKNEAFKQMAVILMGALSTSKNTGLFSGDPWTYSRPARLSTATILKMIEVIYEGAPSPRATADHTFLNGMSAEDGSIESSLSRAGWKEDLPLRGNRLDPSAEEVPMDTRVDPPAEESAEIYSMDTPAAPTAAPIAEGTVTDTFRPIWELLC